MVIRVLRREVLWPVASGFLKNGGFERIYYVFKIRKNIDFFGINSKKIIIFSEFKTFCVYLQPQQYEKI